MPIVQFFLKKIGRPTSPLCEDTDTPVLDFWWHLWVPKSEWAALFALGGGVRITLADLLAASMTAEHIVHIVTFISSVICVDKEDTINSGKY